jgi:hypothetical protein
VRNVENGSLGPRLGLVVHALFLSTHQSNKKAALFSIRSGLLLEIVLRNFFLHIDESSFRQTTVLSVPVGRLVSKTVLMLETAYHKPNSVATDFLLLIVRGFPFILQKLTKLAD